jgi:hypothetical protein
MIPREAAVVVVLKDEGQNIDREPLCLRSEFSTFCNVISTTEIYQKH